MLRVNEKVLKAMVMSRGSELDEICSWLRDQGIMLALESTAISDDKTAHWKQGASQVIVELYNVISGCKERLDDIEMKRRAKEGGVQPTI